MNPKTTVLRLPVVALGAEHLVIGHLMRRNILAYKAPPQNEGYDVIAIHPDPRHKIKRGQKAQVRIQVKSRYASDSNQTVLVKEESLDAFDFLVVALMNIGNFYKRSNGLSGALEPRFFALPREFVKQHHVSTGWGKLQLKKLLNEIGPYEGVQGWDLIASVLGVERPRREQIADLDKNVS